MVNPISHPHILNNTNDNTNTHNVEPNGTAPAVSVTMSIQDMSFSGEKTRIATEADLAAAAASLPCLRSTTLQARLNGERKTKDQYDEWIKET